MAELPVEVLLVEDNPNDLELALHAFRKNNLAQRIQVARDGAEALDFLFRTGAYAGRSQDGGPRLVLLDLKLPKVDGLEVMRRAKSDLRTRAIPIVVLTSSSQESDIDESYRLGANSYLVKPVDYTQLREALRQACSYWLTLNQPPVLRRAA
jgi:two-component system response regulator